MPARARSREGRKTTVISSNRCIVADGEMVNLSVSFTGGRLMEISEASLETIVRSPRLRDGLPMEFESVRTIPTAIFPGRVSALVMATSISLQHLRSIDEPRF